MNSDGEQTGRAGAADIRRVTVAGAAMNVLLALAKLAGGILAVVGANMLNKDWKAYQAQ